jgi:hypothetical protein
MSGAAAGAVMVARNGPKQMLGSAIVGGVLLGGLEIKMPVFRLRILPFSHKKC